MPTGGSSGGSCTIYWKDEARMPTLLSLLFPLVVVYIGRMDGYNGADAHAADAHAKEGG
jgi:hypothetical protein